MWKLQAMSTLFARLAQVGSTRRVCTYNYRHTSILQSQIRPASLVEGQGDSNALEQSAGGLQKSQIGENVSRKDKMDFLIRTLHDLKDTKEAVYGALDAWVAWEQHFPIATLKRVLFTLEKEQQWHRVVQVIKWMHSKGQGNTMGTYAQLVRALDMDQRAEEAHMVWTKKIGSDLHSVPWQFCHCMISVYYRNNMHERLVKLFKGLEAFGRKPSDKAIVQKVANAYELLGMIEDKECVLEKYKHVFEPTKKESFKKYGNKASKEKLKKEKAGARDGESGNTQD